MIGILIVAHGKLGESLLHCSSHVMGKRPEKLEYLVVETNDDPNVLMTKAMTMVNQLNDGDGVLILADMYGATPCNIVTKLVQKNQVEAVAGVNLPMLVRTLTYRDSKLSVLVEKAVSGGREGVVQFDAESCKHD